jgi:hypothetical protein
MMSISTEGFRSAISSSITNLCQSDFKPVVLSLIPIVGPIMGLKAAFAKPAMDKESIKKSDAKEYAKSFHLSKIYGLGGIIQSIAFLILFGISITTWPIQLTLGYFAYAGLSIGLCAQAFADESIVQSVVSDSN